MFASYSHLLLLCQSKIGSICIFKIDDMLQESTGVDLRMPDKSKRGWRKHVPGEEKKYVGLTDIKASHNTTYSRLSKKVFQK